MKTQRIKLSELRQIVKQVIKEGHSSDYSDKWYDFLLGIENLDKYPQDFIDWLDEEDSWAETHVSKYNIKKLIDLFDLWVNEKY